MKLFFRNSIIFLIPIILIYSILIFSINGYADTFYLKFTSPKQKSLVLGTSRALQGINPRTMDSILENNSFIYFFFTVAHSPYGKVYLKAIKEKLKDNNDKGIFIVTIDPWSISSKVQFEDNDSLFRENNLILNQIKSYFSYPNMEYIFKYIKVKEMFFGILRNKKLVGHSLFLNSRGWLKVKIPMDSISIKNRTDIKINQYMINSRKNRLSNVRLSYLIKTLEYLKGRGDVFLVRIPTHPKMVKIENEYMPEFDSIAEKLSLNIDIPYFNYINTSSSYTYTDGNHLFSTSSNLFSKQLADSIKKHQGANKNTNSK